MVRADVSGGGHEQWVGEAAKIRASETRKQKYDGRDAEHILDVLVANHFPRVWTSSREERDLRQLLVHRIRLVRTRTAAKNQLHALVMSQGVEAADEEGASRATRLVAFALGEPAAQGTAGPSR